MARIMKTLAERIGFRTVDMCHDGETALRMMRSRKYEFVLCDIKMHPINGVELVHLIRSEPCGKDCVVVLTSADREAAAAALNSGIAALVDGWILKPFNSDDLHAKLSEIAGRRRPAEGPRKFEPIKVSPRPRLNS
jgi:CheY-like chemotaxis protein